MGGGEGGGVKRIGTIKAKGSKENEVELTMAISLTSASRCCTNEDLAGFLDVAVVVVVVEGRDVIFSYFSEWKEGLWGLMEYLEKN